MKKLLVISILAIGCVACNNNDTSHKGVTDTTKVTIDSPKAVIADSAKAAKDSAH